MKSAGLAGIPARKKWRKQAGLRNSTLRGDAPLRDSNSARLTLRLLALDLGGAQGIKEKVKTA